MENKEEKKVEETKMNNETITKIKEDVEKSIDLSKIEEMISKNEIEFFNNGTKYRVRKTTYKEKQQAYQQQVEKTMELLDNDAYMMEDMLKDKYKKKGIDIDKMTQQMTGLEIKKTDYQLKLGKLLKEKAQEKDLQTYRNEIIKIQEEQLLISIKKTNLLQYSVEHQTLIYVYSYITYLILEKDEATDDEKEDKWVKAFKTYDEFANSEEKLINEASAKAALIVGRI